MKTCENCLFRWELYKGIKNYCEKTSKQVEEKMSCNEHVICNWENVTEYAKKEG